MSERIPGVFSKLKKMIRDNSGSTAVLFAVAMPMVIGSVVMMTEVGFWRVKKADLQATADLAAMAGAYELRLGGDSPKSKKAAFSDALDNGFDPALGSITTNIPPISGSFAGENAVQVVINQEVPTFFSQMFLKRTVNAQVVSVAKLGGDRGEACVLALAPDGTGIAIGGSVSINVDGCSLHANSTGSPSFDVWGAAELTAACASSSGSTSMGGSKPKIFTECSGALSNHPIIPDPYADLEIPANVNSLTCQHTNSIGNGQNRTITFPDAMGGVIRICQSSIQLKNEVTLEAGTYIFDSTEIKFGSGGFISGTDVTIIFMHDAEITNVNGGNGFDIAAPNTGDYAGIAFYADRDTMTNTTWRINGNADMSIFGAIYLPTLDIDYVGGADTNATGCTQLIANRISFNGNSGFTNNCEAAGTEIIPAPGASEVTLVE